MSSDHLKSFPFDESDGATKRFLDSFDRWDESRPTPTGFRAERDAGSIIGELTWLVGGCKRIFPKDDRRTYLLRAVNWKHMGFYPEILDEDLFNMLSHAGWLRGEGRFGRIFDITDGYCAVPRDIRVNEPHVTVIIDHTYAADEKISRAEILTIIAVMMTQLQHRHLEEHCIPPVMVISFMESLQGRILQAHITDSGLVIKKSKLYDFDKQADFEQSITLFSRHMACYRIGDTRQLTKFEIDIQKMRMRTHDASATAGDKPGGKSIAVEASPEDTSPPVIDP